MTTEIISISEYRKNIADFTERANRTNTCFIITSHGKPIGEYRPLKESDVVIKRKYSEDFIKELEEIENEPSTGIYNNTDELFAHLDSI